MCGFLAETEERPLSFYLAVVALVYCVVLTIVFAVWASKRRYAPRPHAPTATTASASGYSKPSVIYNVHARLALNEARALFP